MVGAAKADAEQRGLPDLIPVLDGLAQATEQLRAADWNDTFDPIVVVVRRQGRFRSGWSQ